VQSNALSLRGVNVFHGRERLLGGVKDAARVAKGFDERLDGGRAVAERKAEPKPINGTPAALAKTSECNRIPKTTLASRIIPTRSLPDTFISISPPISPRIRSVALISALGSIGT
jgi:hypothetical protein